MKIVQKGEFPGTRAELEAAIASYRQALEDHKKTVGQPAPWPEYEILRMLVRIPEDQWAMAEDIDEEAGEELPEDPVDRLFTNPAVVALIEAINDGTLPVGKSLMPEEVKERIRSKIK